MYKDKKIFAVIPARSGSKTVRHKNIRIVNDKPMLAYSILHAKESKYIDRIIVSTDSQEYGDIAKSYGAEIPFLRPKAISEDNSLDIECFLHLYEWLEENDELPYAFVHLRATHPVRNSEDIDNMIIRLVDSDATAVRSVSESEETPYKMWLMNEESELEVVATCDVVEAYNCARQQLPRTFTQNACVDVVLASTIKNTSMTGSKILGYVMEYNYDVDTEEQFLVAEKALLLKEALSEGRKLKIVCDIDGVIASKTKGNDYSKALPIIQNIEIINKLFDLGHEVVLFTARGHVTKIDWEERTRTQLKKWGLKYSSLMFNKPNADIYVDDKYYELSMLNELI